ncbi:MAG TPA: hypothetical protein VJQ25_05790 [Nitrospira sp.]|nr:hypothetical protein [Nitrospira sp.]
MFKKTVEFEDLDGNKQSKDFYFHISKAELLELASSADDMQARIKRIIEANDGGAILKELRDLIKMAVGVRSEDGQRFIKDESAQSTLLDSPAFDELLMELATSADASADFVRQLIPEKMQREMQEQLKKNVPADTDNRPAYLKENRNPTEVELQQMSREQLVAAMAWVQQKAK